MKLCWGIAAGLFIFADIGTERYTFSFTIRDSPTYFINVQSWGREEYIRALSESFRVGDCGEFVYFIYSHHVSVCMEIRVVLVALLCFSLKTQKQPNWKQIVQFCSIERGKEQDSKDFNSSPVNMSTKETHWVQQLRAGLQLINVKSHIILRS